MLVTGEAGVVGSGGYGGKYLYFLLNFAVNLKLLKKVVYDKTKQK